MADLEASRQFFRHRTALRRTKLSRPVTLAIRDNVLKPEHSVFDYGSGHGTDVRILTEQGFICSGWDPFYAPDNLKQRAHVVNLGFVLNVIESKNERIAVLRDAFSLARSALIVAVRVDPAAFPIRYADGAVTKRGSFQKIFSNLEFKEFVEGTLAGKLHIAEGGCGYVFQDRHAEQSFTHRRRLAFSSKNPAK